MRTDNQRHFGWHGIGIRRLVETGVVYIDLPGTGRVPAGNEGQWIPAPERRALLVLDSLRRHCGLVPPGGTGSVSNQAAIHRTQVAVADAARTLAPGDLADVTTRCRIPDDRIEAWVADWRARGAPTTILVRVPDA